MINIINYLFKFDEDYLNDLINDVGNKFDNVDVDKYISEISEAYT